METKILKPKTEKKDVMSYEKILEAVHAIAMSCYGVVGLEKKYLLDVENKKTNKEVTREEGIEVKKAIDGTYRIKIYVALGNGVKVTEVLSEVQKRALYELGKAGLKLNGVDVYAQRIESGR